MSHLLKTTALISLMATPTFAEVNALNVWDIFTAQYKSMGLKIEATQIREANTLKLQDIKISGQFPFDWGSITITTTEFSMLENADGTVAVQFPENMPLAVALSLPDDLFITATLDYSHKGYKLLASGDPDNIRLDYSADLIELILTDIKPPEQKDLTAAGKLSMSGISGVTTLQTGEMLTASQTYSVDKTGMDWDYSIKGSAGSKTFLEIQYLDGKNEIVLPNTGLDFANIADQFRNGVSIKTAYTSGTYITKATNSLNGKTVMEQDVSVDKSDTIMSLAQDGFKMKATADNYLVDATVKELPFPIRGKTGRFFGDFQFPLLKNDAQDQDIVYNFSMDDFTMDPEIWALFDQKEILNRNPASFTLNLSGKAKLFYDLLDFEAMKKVGEEKLKFGEISSVRINRLAFSAVNTELTGTGAFNFNNDDLETFGGMPAPDGSILFKLSGLDGLIDNLTEIGLIADDDIMGIRMGIMLMAVTGDKDDTLVSDIKITPDGQISANGKRIK